MRGAPATGIGHYRARYNASHAARCVACHGVRSHAVPVVLVGGPDTQNEYQRLSAMPIDMPPTRFVTAEPGMSRKPRRRPAASARGSQTNID